MIRSKSSIRVLLTLAVVLCLVSGAFAQPAPTPSFNPVTPVVVPLSGSGTVSWTAAALFMKFRNDGNSIILVRNRGTGAATVLTVKSVADPTLGRTGDLTLNVAAATGQTVAIGQVGPLRPNGFNNRTENSMVYLQFDQVTTVDVAVYSFTH